MALPTTPRAWFDAVAWHVRGVFATDTYRRIGFRARDMWQPAEVEARKGVARALATELEDALRVDPARGYVVLSPEATPSLDKVCAIGREIMNGATLEDGVKTGDKPFFRIRVASHAQRLSLLRVALDRRMLAMAAAHLGVLPVIGEADYFCSFPVAGKFTKSQLWHCDCDASDVFKVFVYCDDVTADDGPFELIEASQSRRVRDEIGYRYAGRRYRVADETMDARVPREDQKSILGPAGTAFAVDTVRCFHRGSRIVDPTRRRVMATICYCPPDSLLLPRRLADGSPPLADFVADVSGDLERAALGAPVASRWV